jgi:hypothetical protein
MSYLLSYQSYQPYKPYQTLPLLPGSEFDVSQIPTSINDSRNIPAILPEAPINTIVTIRNGLDIAAQALSDVVNNQEPIKKSISDGLLPSIIIAFGIVILLMRRG